ncbi:hypothetical protein E4U42_002716 [Claviceps africana]|uniref:Uncharacterized protein n=1 Tax=Claviceps africana TaxID=83212 RepID=A0A8K0NHB2_9HYPO|nr:hypothetical protein E4U42_002716 [Claviceps africana]
MAITCRSSTRHCGEPRNRRNPKRASRESISRPKRHERVNYAEDSSDEDDFSDAHSTSASENSSQANIVPASRRSSRIANEHEAGMQSTQHSSSVVGEEVGGAGTKRCRTSGKSSALNNGRRQRRPSRPQLGKRRKLAAPSTPSKLDENSNEIIPDWRDARISFACWVDIFLYAAREGSNEALSTGWLMHAATTCKALTEPALTALYRCPAIKTSAKAKRLAALLDRPVSETLFNYRAKIDTLHINTHIVPPGVLFQLIHPLTRLEELIIFTHLDQPPYRELDKTMRWHYPEDVFTALEADPPTSAPCAKPFPTTLKSWEWSGRFIGGFVTDLDAIMSVHQTRPFSQLTRLSLTNFQVPSLKRLRITSEETELQAYQEDGAVIQSVANAISQLGALTHLVFESSTVMNHRLLPLLPQKLLQLELINCWEVKSEDLAAFLRTHGSQMRTLRLMHNQSLDLAFLTDMNETCPKLRELSMNLSYYRHHDCVNDADPMYDQALLPCQVPSWPSSLRVLVIEHIRDWSVETAEMFLQSIIDCAPALPDLRHLAIKTMLDIPWQARATMRRKWRDKMESVFLRPYVPPACFTTLRPASADSPTPASKKKPSSDGLHISPSRRSSRLASAGELLASHAGSPIKSERQQQQHSRPSYKEPDTDEDEFDSEDGHADFDDVDDDVDEDDAGGGGGGDGQRRHSKNEDESSNGEASSTRDARPSNSRVTTTSAFVHGKCTTVNILFDNQKVRELQYSMEDFGSDESDSEEEWDGDYEDAGSFVVF